ncbi:molybdopterin molybdotransferase MoeA [Phreatobacter sp. AB_2022a]|uniref:molybdopterin molybdotransferase MoeA n=1 Tax=Phreatobacter sp. AB_2022a TaxID=3003134 RepID=UPI0022870DCE|nr:gephyrin-like molybdotransferase Glp [Phreatobacter sp. AB_2022a]MCZ0737833.1 molybdopterin molybdotransferase MoeA [Phreatobacter sp. AB_2022a]
MAQLSPDHFALTSALLSVDDAIARVSANLSPVAETERLGLLEADGRILAEDIFAPIDLPPFFNSAVDGYAVRFADLDPAGVTELALAGRVAAGTAPDRPAATGEAVRIFTGAPMPAGTDTVFMQEDVRLAGERVGLPPGLKAGANCRPAGEDLARGRLALAAGRRITPEAIALIAALGLTQITVRRRVKVAIFSTGDEIVSPGRPLGPAELYDSNRFTLQALLCRLGATVTDLGILPDDRAAVSAALAAAAHGHDLVLTSGGVSMGEEDHVKAAVEAAGSLTFWRLAIKPGRPVAMGVVGGTAFIGLPGNPVAVFVTFAHVVRPFLCALGGGRPEAPPALPVRLTFTHAKKAGRREYVRVMLARAADGVVEAVKHPRDGAGMITSLTETDGLVELGETVTAVQPGDMAGFLPYALLR